MTIDIAIRLIEQFAAQAPFGIWITDSRGISIFANKKVYEMLKIPDHPSKALGLNLFEGGIVEELHLKEVAERAKNGEAVDVTLKIPPTNGVQSLISAGREEPLTTKISCYPLRSSAQKIEHYVIVMRDISEAHDHREQLRQHLRDLEIYNSSRDARLMRMSELRQEAARLEAGIRSLGGVPIERT